MQQYKDEEVFFLFLCVSSVQCFIVAAYSIPVNFYTKQNETKRNKTK